MGELCARLLVLKISKRHRKDGQLSLVSHSGCLRRTEKVRVQAKPEVDGRERNRCE
jgi:hypothetical protein